MKRLLTAAAAVLVLAAGCGEDSDEPPVVGGEGGSGSAPVSLAGKTNEHGTATATGEFEVEADDFYFEPTYIQARASQAFTIEVQNEGNAPHTFTSTELGVDEQVGPGEKKKIKLKAPQTGTALFVCRFHQGQGMQGAVFVR